MLVDHHPGYISWEEYVENQKRLEANVAFAGGEGSGAAKAGAALLSGLLRCGRCGRKLQVAYSGNDGRCRAMFVEAIEEIASRMAA